MDSTIFLVLLLGQVQLAHDLVQSVVGLVCLDLAGGFFLDRPTWERKRPPFGLNPTDPALPTSPGHTAVRDRHPRA
jgi:hypothetical protein